MSSRTKIAPPARELVIASLLSEAQGMKGV